ncbi:hypothetical protein RclHR1_12110004 [Rhizophagus clarus]|uniref:Uncharacterized protein n=1 Tax=Rhizophagus clarus TaxID=94130 RepID=A0A2Z6QLD0_9GLOM|nr:hypothetical protein RclHR1_12110004 [Rhizophagus clarus]GES99107.1 hypothetical protein GLOIN_2v1837659 [Rhizophagus clarus]
MDNNEQYTSFNNVENLNTFNNTATPASQNVTFEFYFPFLLSNDTRIYHVTYQYTELHPLENARLLNNSINLSHILDHQFSLHNNIHSLIRQQIQQQVQQPVYQQNNVQQQQIFDTTLQPTSQVCSDNNNNYDTSSNTVNDNIPGDMRFQNSS